MRISRQVDRLYGWLFDGISIKKFFILAAVFLGFIYGVTQVALLLNGNWVYEAAKNWEWWNYFTTKSGLMVLYINHPVLYFILIFALSLFGASMFNRRGY